MGSRGTLPLRWEDFDSWAASVFCAAFSLVSFDGRRLRSSFDFMAGGRFLFELLLPRCRVRPRPTRLILLFDFEESLCGRCLVDASLPRLSFDGTVEPRLSLEVEMGSQNQCSVCWSGGTISQVSLTPCFRLTSPLQTPGATTAKTMFRISLTNLRLLLCRLPPRMKCRPCRLRSAGGGVGDD